MLIDLILVKSRSCVDITRQLSQGLFGLVPFVFTYFSCSVFLAYLVFYTLSTLWSINLVFLYTSLTAVMYDTASLGGLPTMYHLMKFIPLYSKVQRPCTSTPMMNSL